MHPVYRSRAWLDLPHAHLLVNVLKIAAIQLRFLAESTLGRLSKWLRLAGLDIRYDNQSPDPLRLARICHREKRILLTRTRRIATCLPAARTLYIPCSNPVAQARLVMQALGLEAGDLRPMIRCGSCNHVLQKVDKALVGNRVPEYVLQNQTTFNLCPECQTLYWQGSHAKRWLAFMDQWFGA